MLFLVILTGCSKESSVAEDSYTIGFSQCSDDMWRQIMMIQMEAEATRFPNLHLIIKEAHGSTDVQVRQIRDFIEEGVDLLIISPNESQPVTAPAVEAYRNGIPTIVWDRKIESQEYTTFISADNYSIGRDVGRYVQSVLPEGSSILEISGLRGSSPAKDRHQGFMDVIGTLYKVTTISGDWLPAVAKARVEDIQNHNQFDLVFGHNDDMALAAYDAMSARDSAAASRIRFIGIDAIVGVDAVIDGRMDASFLYPPGGEFVVETAMKILNGEPVERTYTLKSSIVDESNAATLKAQSEQILQYQNHINDQRKQMDELSSKSKYMNASMAVLGGILALMIALVVVAFTANRRIRRKNSELELKRIQTERQTEDLIAKNAEIETLSNQKLQFFTNLSHEVRTPLTLIINPLDNLSKHESDPKLKKDIWVLQRNAKHLLKIVNQILDFRKIENNKMTIKARRVDIVSMTEEIVKYFETYAESEKIVYKFVSEVRDPYVWIDTDKIEQVLINLISNAFKNSRKFGVITVSVTENENDIVIEVHDTGRGMDLNTQQHLFDRFYSVGNPQGHGIGIGLHLSKEYAEMHSGSLSFESEPGDHTSFFLTIKKGNMHFTPEQLAAETDCTAHDITELDSSIVSSMLEKWFDETILIAEDDEDIRAYLEAELSKNFNVIAVPNGYEATMQIQQQDISLILSDVLMPHVNGFQLCRNIKQNMATSHIPVVLLTALVDDSQQLYGLAEGADEYIKKPFNIDYLRAKLIRIIEHRLEAQSNFRNKLDEEKVFDISFSESPSADSPFKEHLMSLLENRYSDCNLSVEDMSSDLCLSRVQLYRKTKALFGLTPTDLLRSYRLTRAAVLLAAGNVPVSEVAFDTGFSSPAYFAKCFKEKFGISPSNYVKENDN